MALVFWADAKWESPYVFSTYVALVEKRIPFEVRALDLARGDQREAAFAGPSLLGKVPAIEHDGFWLTESLAIAEYLEEAFPAVPLLPEGLRDRARARQLMSWLRSDLMPLRQERPTSSIFRAPVPSGAPGRGAPLSAEARAAADKLVRVASAVVRPGAPSLFGSGFALVDADLAMMLHRLIANDDPVPEPVRSYAVGVWQRPSVRAFVALDRAGERR